MNLRRTALVPLMMVALLMTGTIPLSSFAAESPSEVLVALLQNEDSTDDAATAEVESDAASESEDGGKTTKVTGSTSTEETDADGDESSTANGAEGMTADGDDTDAKREEESFTWTAAEELTYTINTIVMFFCAVLVIFMQSGFAMLEAGLNSAKNVVNILCKNVMDLCLGVLLFLVVGYNLMYPGWDEGEEVTWFKWGGTFISRDAQQDSDGNWTESPTYVDGEPYASNAVDFLFQVAFAATAATIVSGAVAGRMKFVGYLVYTVVLTGFIYPISGMWKWGGGPLAEWGFADFAGSVVVHAVGGFAGLAGAIVLGARKGRYTAEGKSIPIPGHNIAMAALGVFILWVGWYGFNPGSQLAYSDAINAETTTWCAVTTTIAAAAGGAVALFASWIMFGKPDLTMALNGVLAGLVSITANCDQVSQESALIIGAVGGVLVVFGIILLDRLKIDDPVGAWPVHGLCGVWGGIATGIFGAVLPEFAKLDADGNEMKNAAGEVIMEAVTRSEYIMIQLKSTVVICVWAFFTMLVLFAIMKGLNILRVSEEEESRGLDIGEHGMPAYAHVSNPI